MLELICSIFFIHNNSNVISNNFAIPSNQVGTFTNGFTPVRQITLANGDFATVEESNSQFGVSDWNDLIDTGKDVALFFPWVNEIEIESSFKCQADKAKITLPRNLNFDGINLSKKDDFSPNPLFNRGDRVVIQLGYFDQYNRKSLGTKTVFQGYVSRIGLTTPLVIECEDKMFALKQTLVQYPAPGESTSPKTLINLLKRILLGNQNPLIGPGQDNFVFGTAANTATNLNVSGKIPVICPLDIPKFSYSTKSKKSIADVFAELKKDFGLFVYFDDFGNLHVELPYMNSKQLASVDGLGAFTSFLYENQVIDDKNMKFQEADNVKIRVEYSSAAINKTGPTLYANCPATQSLAATGYVGDFGAKGYVGDALGDKIEIHAYPGIDQDTLNLWAQQVLIANKYTGYAKGSSFETFGEPAVFIGQGITMTSDIHPEKNGSFQIVGKKIKFGMNGYRQIIEVGPQINPTN